MSIVQDVTWVGGVELQEREAQRGREPCEESAITITWGVASVSQGFIQGKTFMQALAVIKDGDDDPRTTEGTTIWPAQQLAQESFFLRNILYYKILLGFA